MKRKRQKIPSKDEEHNLAATLLNDDWIRSARLLDRMEAGDKKAIKEFNKRDNTPMVKFKNSKL